MALSTDEIKHVARLARLGLSQAEEQQFADQLSAILDHFKKLEEVDTEAVELTAQVTGLENVFRRDEIEKIDRETRDALLGLAPEREDDLVKAKSVFN